MSSEEKLRIELEQATVKTESLKNKLNEIYESKLKENSEKFKALNGQLNAKTEEIIMMIHAKQRKLLDQVKSLTKLDDELDFIHLYEMNSKPKITADLIGKLETNKADTYKSSAPKENLKTKEVFYFFIYIFNDI